MKDAFRAIDLDYSGVITLKEIGDMFERRHMVMDVAKKKHVLKLLDRGGDGEISYAEFNCIFGQAIAGGTTDKFFGRVKTVAELKAADARDAERRRLIDAGVFDHTNQPQHLVAALVEYVNGVSAQEEAHRRAQARSPSPGGGGSRSPASRASPQQLEEKAASPGGGGGGSRRSRSPGTYCTHCLSELCAACQSTGEGDARVWG